MNWIFNRTYIYGARPMFGPQPMWFGRPGFAPLPPSPWGGFNFGFIPLWGRPDFHRPPMGPNPALMNSIMWTGMFMGLAYLHNNVKYANAQKDYSYDKNPWDSYSYYRTPSYDTYSGYRYTSPSTDGCIRNNTEQTSVNNAKSGNGNQTSVNTANNVTNNPTSVNNDESGNGNQASGSIDGTVNGNQASKSDNTATNNSTTVNDAESAKNNQASGSIDRTVNGNQTSKSDDNTATNNSTTVNNAESGNDQALNGADNIDDNAQAVNDNLNPESTDNIDKNKQTSEHKIVSGRMTGVIDENKNIFLDKKVTSKFGKRKHPITGKYKIHGGIDLKYSLDEDVYSFTDGTVIFAGQQKDKNGNLIGYGNWIEIEDANGIRHRYAHADKLLVKVGQKVKAGELIMKAGKTGSATGPHVHYETIVNDKKVNPFKTWKKFHQK